MALLLHAFLVPDHGAVGALHGGLLVEDAVVASQARCWVVVPSLFLALCHVIARLDNIAVCGDPGGRTSARLGGDGEVGRHGRRGSGGVQTRVQGVAAHHVLHLSLRLLDHIVEGGPVVT